MTWSKALSLSHDGSTGSGWWENVAKPYFAWMGTQPGITTTYTNAYTTTGYAGIKYSSTRFGNTYNHGYIYYYATSTNGTFSVFNWLPADQATNSLNQNGQKKREDTYFSRALAIADYEVWQSDEHKSWFLFERTVGNKFSYVRGAFMDPDDLTQGAEIGGKQGWRETAVISDSFNCLGNVDPQVNAFTNSGWLQSIWDRKSSEVLIKNWYALFASTYDFDTASKWMYNNLFDIGYTYMGQHNDMHCSGSAGSLGSVVQLESDPNYYINVGGTGSGLFLDCGTSAPNFFGYAE